MDFELSDEQRLIRETARDLVGSEPIIGRAVPGIDALT